MFNLNQVSISIAAIAATATMLHSTTAEAAIVSGRVSGVWQYSYSPGASLNQPFTADYTFDTDSITEIDYSSPGQYNYPFRRASLLSLVLNSSSFNHTFDFSPNVGSGVIDWVRFQSTSPDSGYGQLDYEYVEISAYDVLANVYNRFYAYNYSGVEFYGAPFSNSYARGYSYDYNPGNVLGGYGDNASFSGATPAPNAIPTPALLPGLIGMGVSVLRKHKRSEAIAK
jgi:hypothetical protein